MVVVLVVVPVVQGVLVLKIKLIIYPHLPDFYPGLYVSNFTCLMDDMVYVYHIDIYGFIH